jgi:UDP-sugar pyrophosphorylase
MKEMEEMGMKELSKLGFVLIAGGLGERLGYSGIKIGLPVSIIEPNYTYLKFYTQYVHACKERALALDSSLNKDTFYVPFCIMVSGDTGSRTRELLE